MNLIKKVPVYLFIFLGVIYAKTAYAVCPICTVAVCAGIGLSRWLGIDDSISGLWIGGLTVSMIMWTLDWLDRKNIKFSGRDIIIILTYYIIIFVPLYATGIVGHPLNVLCGVDKILLGAGLGSIGFFGFAWWYQYLKKKNNGKAYFPFQKVVMPITPLIILSIIFYFLTK